MEDKKFCKYCGESIDKEAIVCPKCGRQLKLVDKEELKKAEIKKEKEQNRKVKDENQIDKPKFYKQSWFMWIMLIFFAPVGIYLLWQYHPEIKKELKIFLSVVFSLFFLYALFSQPNNEDSSINPENKSTNNEPKIEAKAEVEVIDFSTMQEIDILKWCNDNNLECNFKREYSDTIGKDGFIKQSTSPASRVKENSKITITYSLGKKPTIGQQNALKKAKTYSDYMHMSKSGIYKQLTSEYGEGFTAEEAQYAIDNLVADWNNNALEKAKTYQTSMSMSKSAIYQQLVSEYGEGFTPEEAQYAIDHLED